MSKGLKILGIILLVVVVLAAAGFGAWRWFTRQAFPETDGTVKVAGLNQPVEILRDEYGVAHIYAETLEDLYFAEGYVHAQERFWQMEFQRRLGAGRMSEIFGEATLETDRFLRQFDFDGLAQQAYEMAGPEAQQILDAYSAGVNAYIGDRTPGKLGLEFALLGLQGVDVEIEPWKPAHSLVWAEMLIFNQADVPPAELGMVETLATVGEDLFADLLPPYRDDRPVIISPDELATAGSNAPTLLASLEPQALAYIRAAAQSIENKEVVPAMLDRLGLFAHSVSNSFAISGDLTASGMPMLANDPHMGIDMPSLWYEIGLQCNEKSETCPGSLRGFSLPGVPGILIGHSDRIAWGLTNAAFDAEDVFIERLNPDNPDQYEVDGKWVDMEIRQEEITVRGRSEPDVITTRFTRNGLVITDHIVDQAFFTYDDDRLQPYALAMAWTALEPVRSGEAVIMANWAQNWDDFVDALQYFEAGKQNWLYADVDGNIGYIMPGKVPIRAGGDGTLPVPGWNDDYRWTGFIPYEDAPRTFNPDKGYIVTANNPQVRADSYDYFLGRFQERGQRAQRITDLLSRDPDGISIEDMMAAQTDNQSLPALEIIPYLADVALADADQSAARDRLLAWNGQMLKDSPEAALYAIFWKNLVVETFHDQAKANQVDGSTFTADTVALILPEPGNIWWDDARTVEQIEDRYDIYQRTFSLAWTEAVDLLGEKMDDWRWGDLHTKEFRNATLGSSGIGFIENIFNRGPVAVSGSDEVPNKTDWSISDPYRVTGVIPALRQVIDLGDLGNSRMIHAVGQSGHPMNKYYDHFIDLWRNFEYHPSNWERSAAESGRHDVLVLEPAS